MSTTIPDSAVTDRPTKVEREQSHTLKTDLLPEPPDDGSEVPDVEVPAPPTNAIMCNQPDHIAGDDKMEEDVAAYARAREAMPLWQQKFIDALKRCPIVVDAAKAANINRRLAERWREKDRAFREAWAEALEDGWDEAEKAAYMRGVQGIEVPITSRNKDGTTSIIGYEIQHSDRLLEFVLKGNRPKIYREPNGPVVAINFAPVEQAIEVAVNGGLLDGIARRLTERAADSGSGR